jgi:hypothetical protein
VYALVFNPAGVSLGLALTGITGGIVWGIVYAIVLLVGARVLWGKIGLDLDPGGEPMQTIAVAHLAYGSVLGILAAVVPHLRCGSRESEAFYTLSLIRTSDVTRASPCRVRRDLKRRVRRPTAATGAPIAPSPLTPCVSAVGSIWSAERVICDFFTESNFVNYKR